MVHSAVRGRILIRAFGYVVRTKTGEEKPFFEALTKLGIETRIRDLQEYYDGLKKPIGMLVLQLMLFVLRLRLILLCFVPGTVIFYSWLTI